MHFHSRSQKKRHGHGNRTLDMDLYAVKSGLANVNPDFKFWVGVLSLCLCLLSPNGITSIVISIAMIGIILRIGKVKAKDYFRFIQIPLSFILLSQVVLLFDFSKFNVGEISIPFYGYYIIATKETFNYSVLVSIKALCSVTCLYMISLSTPMYEIIAVLRRCKVPEIMIELMYLIYRFIFVLLEAYQNMKQSAKTRLGNTNLIRSYHSFFGICMNLFVISYQKASKHFDAMEARGYNGHLRFLEEKKVITTKHIIICMVYAIIILTVFTIERVWICQLVF